MAFTRRQRARWKPRERREREAAVVTPENRARMKAVLSRALQQSYLPGAAHAADAASAKPSLHRQDERGSRERTAAGTPATVAGSDPEALVVRFCEELEALAGVAYRVNDVHAAADRVAAIVARTESGQTSQPRQPRPILSWNMEEIGLPGLGAALSVRGIVMAPPEVPFSEPEHEASLGPLAELTVGLTGAQAAIAESGSIVLASGPGRGRLSSLLTPLHIAILRRENIVRTLEELFETRPELTTLGSNCVIVTGPSRTGDIEMTLSRGVHGPGEIHVIVV
jgi:L-lactate dehydrogenase complex protein LldG